MLPLLKFASCHPQFVSFFFNDTATTEIYTLSLHDALPIYLYTHVTRRRIGERLLHQLEFARAGAKASHRSEEHTSELQSLTNIVYRLLLEKKQMSNTTTSITTF